jgi:hypothetical protein
MTVIITVAPLGRVILNTALQMRRDLRGRYMAVGTLAEARLRAIERLAQEI